MSVQLTMLGQKVLDFNVPLFVKWAGGKTQLLNSINEHLPKKIPRYFEPFVGGGAVFFFIQKNFNPDEVFLSDVNKELINTYKIIKNNVNELISLLEVHKENNSKEYFYKIRALNKPVNHIKELTNVERAARMIYLNKTCYNGLYRVNSDGQFNVPYGKYKNPGIYGEQRLKKTSKLLGNVELRACSYKEILSKVKKNDFVYLDPPYYPLNGNSFTSYTKNDFGKKEHVELANFYKKLSDKRVKVMLSNSYTPKVLELYSDFNVHKVMARRAINSNGNDRGEVKEVIVTNY